MDQFARKREKAWRDLHLTAGFPVETTSSSNYVSVGRHSPFVFFPKTLAEQFVKVSTIWFIFITLVALNPLDLDYPESSLVGILTAVLVLTAVGKEAVPAWKVWRHTSRNNDEVFRVWTGNTFAPRKCKNIKVGDCVLLEENIRVPADMVLLACSSDNGSCYIDTTAIMGENNYSLKAAVKITNDLLQKKDSPQLFDFSRLNGVVKFEQPNSDFESFAGLMKLQHMPRGVPLKGENFVMRGGKLHGVVWGIGLTVYVGMDTKIWSCRIPSFRRSSSFTRTLSKWTVVTTLTAVCLSAILTLLQSQLSSQPPLAGDFLQYVLLSSGLVPVAMFICLDIIRIVHSLLLTTRQSGSSQVMINTGELNEDLGKVNYVLADKTGTLTENQLDLVAIYASHSLYTKAAQELPATHRSCSSVDSALGSNTVNSPLATVDGRGQSSFPFSSLSRRLRSPDSDLLTSLCEGLALCNTVTPQSDGSIVSVSVEEEAVVRECKSLGLQLLSRRVDFCDVDFFDTCFTYQVVCCKEFCPELRRMRIVVAREVDDSLVLYIKGSYSVLKEFMTMSCDEEGEIETQVQSFKAQGLRTMVLCYRRLSEETSSEVRAKALSAKLTRGNEDGRLEVLFQELENDLRFLAVLGISDLILPETRETVQVLRKAGIETWVVSGDSQSSTLACAYSLGLICPSSELVHLRGAVTPALCERKLLRVISENIFHNTPIDLDAPDSQVEVQLASLLERYFEPESVNFALSIDGNTVEAALKETDTQRLLACVLFAADVVCFNRMQPNHKREVVKLLREVLATKPVVLAVGDDSGDIPMLAEADVGVGVRGKESRQITYSSDISIRKFHFLAELILSHGKSSIFLLGQTVHLYIHASTLLFFMQLALVGIADCTASVQSLEVHAMYSLVFTSPPIVYIAIVNNKVAESTLNAYNCRGFSGISWKSMGWYLLLSFTHFCATAALLFPAFLAAGESSVLSTDEVCAATVVVCSLVSVLQCSFEVKRATAGLLAAQISALSAMAAYYVLNEEMKPAFLRILTTPSTVLGVAGAVLICGVSSLAIIVYCRNFDIRKLGVIVPLAGARRSSLVNRARGVSGALLNVFRMRKFFMPIKEHSSFDIDYRRAVFKSAHTESVFEQEYIASGLPLFKKLMALLLLQIATPIFHDLVDGEPKTAPRVAFVIGGFSAALLLLSFWVRLRLFYSVQLFALTFLIITCIIDLSTGSSSVLIYFCVSTGVLILLREKWILSLGIAVLAVALLAIVTAAKSREDLSPHCITAAVGSFVIQVMGLFVAARVSYQSAIRDREEFALIKQTAERVSQNDNILRCLLPDFVQKRVKDGIRYIAEDQGLVTIIFIEICEFDDICAGYSPPELLVLLDDIFQKIDLLCQSIRVAKIETVGKVYMACSGLRDFELEVSGDVLQIPHAQRALDLSLAVLSTFKNYQLVNGKKLQFKIGIHSGELVAGVVGFHKPQFSLVGDTVNTASRVCTTITSPNTVQISEETSALLDPTSITIFRPRVVTAKGKGTLKLLAATDPRKTYTIQSRGASSSESTSINRLTTQKLNSWLRFSFIGSAELGDLYCKSDQELVEKVKLLHCGESPLERTFRSQSIAERQSLVHMGMVTYLLGLCALCLWRTARYSSDMEPWELAVAVVYFSLCAAMLTMRVFLCSLQAKTAFPWLLMAIYAITASTVTVDEYFDETFPAPIAGSLLGLLLLLVCHCSGALFGHGLTSSLLVVAPWSVLKITQESWQTIAIVLLLSSAQHNCCLYTSERTQRSFFNFSQLAKRELEKTERLLAQMLPMQAYESLKRDEWTNDRLMDVTVLYADISGFTQWSATRTPQEVIDKLSRIFTAFDQVCVRRGVYKVHTIGDCYVALGATSNSVQRRPEEEAVRMVELGMEMVDIVREANGEDGLSMRIGLHMGEVVAGITGTQAVRYDIYGADVLIANKMESSGQVGKVNISESLKEVLEKAAPEVFAFEYNRRVEIPETTTAVDCYFVSQAEKRMF